jgi:hypothetical protein
MMPGMIRILIALDGTPGAETALAAVMPLVRSTPSELLLFRGVARAEEGKDARTYLVRLSEALNGQNVRSAISVETGEPGPAILARLQSGAFDVGALTTHGRTGMTRVLLGSAFRSSSTGPTRESASGGGSSSRSTGRPPPRRFSGISSGSRRERARRCT